MNHGQRGDDAVALDIASAQCMQMANTKAVEVIKHQSKFRYTSVSELILPREHGFEPIMFKFYSASRDDVSFEVMDENSNEIFEEQIRYAVSSMPSICLKAASTILNFYGIKLDMDSAEQLKALFKEAVQVSEGMYGSSPADDELFGCNAVVFIALHQQYTPEGTADA